MADIVRTIKECPSSWYIEPGVSEQTILRTEKGLGLVFSSEFKKYLRAYGEASIPGIVDLVGLGDDVSKPSHAGAINKYILNSLTGNDMQKGIKNTKGKYVIGVTPKRKYLMQDTSGATYEFDASNGNIKRVANSLEQYIKNNFDKIDNHSVSRPINNYTDDNIRTAYEYTIGDLLNPFKRYQK